MEFREFVDMSISRCEFHYHYYSINGGEFLEKGKGKGKGDGKGDGKGVAQPKAPPPIFHAPVPPTFQEEHAPAPPGLQQEGSAADEAEPQGPAADEAELEIEQRPARALTPDEAAALGLVDPRSQRWRESLLAQ